MEKERRDRDKVAVFQNELKIKGDRQPERWKREWLSEPNENMAIYIIAAITIISLQIHLAHILPTLLPACTMPLK